MKNALAILILLGTVMSQLSCSTSPKNKTTEGPRVHNLGPAFIAFWNSVKNKTPDEQVAALKKDFFPKFPEFYKYKVDKWKRLGGNPDKALKRELVEFPKIEKDFVNKTQQISKDLDSTIQTFLSAIPDFNTDIDVYITHSFGDMDGGTRNINDKVYFILGLDGMVKYHKGMTSETPFFHHEFFHVYQNQFISEEEVVGLALWVEGVATYASKKLNPQATYKDLLIDLPSGMVDKINKDLKFHWNDLESKLESKDEKHYTQYFLMNSKHKRVVIRAGYYLGYLIAKEVGKTKTLSEMARMKYEDVLLLLKSTIKKLKAEMKYK